VTHACVSVIGDVVRSMRARASAAPSGRPLRAPSPSSRGPRRAARRARPPRATSARASNAADDDDDDDDDDLLRDGLSPWDVLGVSETTRASRGPDGPSVAEVKAAYRARMKVYHPDVYRGDGDGEAIARKIVAAYVAVVDDAAADGRGRDGVDERFPWAGARRGRGFSRLVVTPASSRRAHSRARSPRSPPPSPSDPSRPPPPLPARRRLADDDADPFESPEGPATTPFVNPFACRGVTRCPEYCRCVATHAAGFERDPKTGAARFKPSAASYGALSATPGREGDAYAMHLAVGQCPEMAIHWTTPRQATRLTEVAERLDGGGVGDEWRFVAEELYGLIAKANYENGRAAAPASKRTPRRSDEWVDWY
jgi:ferredoxin